MLYKTAYLILVRVERQVVILEVIYTIFVTFLIGAFFAAYAAYRAGIAWEYACKGVSLIMMDNAVLIGIDIYILRTCGQFAAGCDRIFPDLCFLMIRLGNRRVYLCVVCHIR